MNKPRKALKSLFARTEPELTSDVPASPMDASSETVKIASEHPAAEAVVPSETAPIVNSTPAPAPQIEAMAEAVPAPQIEAMAEAVPTLLNEVMEQATVIPDAVPTNEVGRGEGAQEIVAAEPAVVASVSAAAEPAVVASVSAEREAHSATMAAAVMRVQYSFEVAKEERETWGQREYVDFIRRIDVAQAEAFFLKGHLLSEMKEKFFLENKVGWRDFSEKVLGLNYTTANQYIRVCQEFDVTSHRRPDFGFEHYKALLPLKVDERAQLLSELPQVSVKELRSIVQQKLSEGQPAAPGRAGRTTVGREMIELLVSLKEKISRCAQAPFSQTERWQLSAACRNLALDLESLAHEIDAVPRRTAEARNLGASAFSEPRLSGD